MKKYNKYEGEKVHFNHERFAHVLKSHEKHSDLKLWTVFTKDPSCGKGEYSEELDVLVPYQHSDRGVQALHVAQAVIDAEYDAELRPTRAVFRPAGIMFT